MDIDTFSNELSHAQLERLAILAEELGEAQQVVGKIIRHGYESYNPVVDTGMTNRRELERELGDIALAVSMMTLNGDVNAAGIEARRKSKAISIQSWLHHQEPVQP